MHSSLITSTMRYTAATTASATTTTATIVPDVIASTDKLSEGKNHIFFKKIMLLVGEMKMAVNAYQPGYCHTTRSKEG